MRVLRQSLQIATPHERPLSSAHRRAAVSMRSLWKDVFAVDDSEGAREDPLSQICAQVPLAQSSRHGGGESALAAVVATQWTASSLSPRPPHQASAAAICLAAQALGYIISTPYQTNLSFHRRPHLSSFNPS